MLHRKLILGWINHSWIFVLSRICMPTYLLITKLGTEVSFHAAVQNNNDYRYGMFTFVAIFSWISAEGHRLTLAAVSITNTQDIIVTDCALTCLLLQLYRSLLQRSYTSAKQMLRYWHFAAGRRQLAWHRHRRDVGDAVGRAIEEGVSSASRWRELDGAVRDRLGTCAVAATDARSSRRRISKPERVEAAKKTHATECS